MGGFTVRRALPRRGLRTVGAWCFADHMGPAQVTETAGLDVGPHPHTGLQTVTWLMAGAVLHRDSLGSEQVIRPGQLNLMTAGHGVVHAEEATDTYRGTLHGVQLWVAQPDEVRDAGAGFEHVAALPVVEVGRSQVTVLAGEFGGVMSPARFDTSIVGVDAVVRPGTTDLAMRPEFEYVVIATEGAVDVEGSVAIPGQSVSLGTGRDEIRIGAVQEARVLILGGVPFTESLLMWWNFVARTREEINEAYRQWQDGDERFGDTASGLARIPAPRPVWLRH